MSETESGSLQDAMEELVEPLQTFCEKLAGAVSEDDIEGADEQSKLIYHCAMQLLRSIKGIL